MSEKSNQHIETTAPVAVAGPEGPSVEFFAVGLAINLVLIVAFFVWAFRQGKK